jgi:inner membrane transporter RhtA
MTIPVPQSLINMALILWADLHVRPSPHPGADLIGLGIAVLCPVLPFLLEFFALRRLTAGAFGMLMAVEPAFAMLAGLVMLDQVPDVGEAFGIGLVIVAGIGGARAGARMESLVAPIVGSR